MIYFISNNVRPFETDYWSNRLAKFGDPSLMQIIRLNGIDRSFLKMLKPGDTLLISSPPGRLMAFLTLMLATQLPVNIYVWSKAEKDFVKIKTVL